MRRTFEQWMAAVDDQLSRRAFGLTTGDLPDFCYRDAFEAGRTPANVARAALRVLMEA